MPLDSTPTKTLTKEDKLNRLLYHLSHATDDEQRSYCYCLAHRCQTDPILQDAGLPKQFWFTGLSRREAEIYTPEHRAMIWRKWLDFFGITEVEATNIFSALPVIDKKIRIRNMLDQC